jgi:hypothetical protein
MAYCRNCRRYVEGVTGYNPIKSMWLTLCETRHSVLPDEDVVPILDPPPPKVDTWRDRPPML